MRLIHGLCEVQCSKIQCNLETYSYLQQAIIIISYFLWFPSSLNQSWMKSVYSQLIQIRPLVKMIPSWSVTRCRNETTCLYSKQMCNMQEQFSLCQNADLFSMNYFLLRFTPTATERLSRGRACAVGSAQAIMPHPSLASPVSGNWRRNSPST